MTTRQLTTQHSLFLALLLTAGCSSFSATIVTADKDAGGDDGGVTGGKAGTAGASSTGGFKSIGGSSSSGGTTSLAGTSTSGGSSSLGTATGGVYSGTTGGSPTVGGSSSSAGTTSAGGTTSTGGALAVGGMSTTGGTKLVGGTSATGGALATGGATTSGGTTTLGGSISTGGSRITGGSSSTGGLTATGGIQATGGASSTGGAGTGGSSCTRSVTQATPISPFESTWQTCPESNATLTNRVLKRPAPSLHVARGDAHTCVATASGTVRCWGNNFDGELGYGNTNTIGDNELPKSAGDVAVGGTVVQITAGDRYTCAVLSGGSVRCWGYAFGGALGYGSANTNNIGDNELPQDVGDVNVGGLVVQVSCGAGQTCALLEGGTVRCWGTSSNGALGYGNTSSVGVTQTPAAAGDVNIGGSVLQISAGYGHTCALLDNGSVRCWGWNNYGQLGYGNTNNIGDNETPASVGNVNIGGKAVQVSAGGYHTCALLDTGSVRCWGNGSSGQLGYSSTNNVGDVGLPSAAGDVNVGGKVVQIAAGVYSTCALLDSGSLRCWGAGSYGVLGYGNINNIGDDELPADAGDVPVGGLVAQVSTNGGPNSIASTCAFLRSGSLRCWGANGLGQLGYGNTTNVGDTTANTPAAVGNVLFQ